jgi:hypothetical protein
MPTCERCGKDLPDNITFCPVCGTLIPSARSAIYQPLRSTTSAQPGMSTFNSTAFGNAYTRVRSTKNNTPLVVEILLNLFLSLYGVGWLMAGERVIGVLLLIGSLLVYWPALILGIIFTSGLGIFSFGALALGLIILNAVLLNNYLNRKAARRMRTRSR